MENLEGRLEYKLDVLAALKDAGYNTGVLRKRKLLSECSIQHLREGKMVATSALAKICNLLNCDICDLIQMTNRPQAPHVWADWISKQMEFANERADPMVLRFIQDFVCRVPGREDAVIKLFTQGYCYYFAQILQFTFRRGMLCVPGFKSHIVWVDGDDPDNDVAYDVHGIYDNYTADDINDCLIPIEYFGDWIYTVLHDPRHGDSKETDWEALKSRVTSAYLPTFEKRKHIWLSPEEVAVKLGLKKSGD